MRKQNVIFIHGLGNCHTNVNNYLLLDREKYNITSLKLPGSPESRYKKLETINQFTNWLKEQICLLELASYSLVGWSFGGLLVNHLAETEPTPELQNVVCISTPFFGIHDFIKSSYDLYLSVNKNQTLVEIIKILTERLAQAGITLSEQDFENLQHSDPRYMLNGISIIQSYKQTLKPTKVRRLIIADPYDMFIPPSTIKFIEASVSTQNNTILKIIEHSGHMGNYEGIRTASSIIENYI